VNRFFNSVAPFLVIAVIVFGGLPSCGLRFGGDSTVSAENDRLRSENADLKKRIEELERMREEFRRKVEAIPGGPSADVMEALPALAIFSVTSTSHIRAAREDKPATAVVYLDCRDGRDRPIQVTGTLHLNLSTEVTGGVETVVSPLELRAAYRGGVTGGGYTIEVPLDAAAVSPFGVSARFVDGVTGSEYIAERRELQVLERPVRAGAGEDRPD